MESSEDLAGPGETFRSFCWRVAEVRAWCAGRTLADDPQGSMRTAALRPPGWREEGVSEWGPGGFAHWNADGSRRAVEAVVAERGRRLRHADTYPPAPTTDLGGGRLVVYCPEQSLYDGAAEAHTRGFFDGDNTPPWDTWLRFVVEAGRGPPPRELEWPSYLISWVPPELVELVDEGIWFNPEECLLRAEDLRAGFVDLLRSRGLLD